VFLLDIRMPTVTGLEVLKVIRADPALNSTPVVMPTQLALPLDAEWSDERS
jgi:CheY-like chemotaxis protein